MKPLEQRRRRTARERFNNCVYSYAAENIYEIATESDVTRRGSCFHLAASKYITALAETDQLSDHELAAMALTAALVEIPLPFEQRLDLHALWARWVPTFELRHDQFYATEAAIDLPLYSTKVTYDLVLVTSPDTLRIVDFKTWWNIPSDTALRDSYQTHFYLSAARHLFPKFHRYELVYEHVRYGTFSEPLTISQGEMDEFDQSIAEGDAAMLIAEEVGAFPATGGAHCSTCMAVCPLVQSFRVSERLETQRDAEHAIGYIAALRRAAWLMTSVLKEYCAANGPLVSGGIEWAHRPQTRSRYPAADVLDALSAAGIHDAVRLTVSQSQVNPLLKSKRKYAAVADEIRALAITKTETVFEGKTVALLDERAPQEEEAARE